MVVTEAEQRRGSSAVVGIQVAGEFKAHGVFAESADPGLGDWFANGVIAMRLVVFVCFVCCGDRKLVVGNGGDDCVLVGKRSGAGGCSPEYKVVGGPVEAICAGACFADDDSCGRVHDGRTRVC